MIKYENGKYSASIQFPDCTFIVSAGSINDLRQLLVDELVFQNHSRSVFASCAQRKMASECMQREKAIVKALNNLNVLEADHADTDE